MSILHSQKILSGKIYHQVWYLLSNKLGGEMIMRCKLSQHVKIKPLLPVHKVDIDDTSKSSSTSSASNKLLVDYK